MKLFYFRCPDYAEVGVPDLIYKAELDEQSGLIVTSWFYDGEDDNSVYEPDEMDFYRGNGSWVEVTEAEYNEFYKKELTQH